MAVLRIRAPLLTKCFPPLGEHESYEVDSRLLFKIEYCLPDCGSKRSRKHCLPVDQDEVG